MKVLVTGANSLLGTNILVKLLDDGYHVKAMVRSPDKLLVSHSHLEICLGDITDAKAVSEAVKGCDYVVHAAADTSQASLDYNKYEKVNVEGTAHVLKAAEDCGVKRVVFISSATAFAFGTKENPGTEKGQISYPFSKACYSKSKYEAQLYALAQEKEMDTEVVVVNPSFMLGEYDSKPSSGQIILKGYRKRFIFAPPGGKSFIHVKDAAVAVCNALQLGKSGEAYLLTNENMSYKAFYRQLMSVTGQKSIIITIPKFILLFIGLIGSIFIRIGIATPAYYMNMNILCVKNYFDSSKAQEVLHLKSSGVSVAIKDAIGWFSQKGMLK